MLLLERDNGADAPLRQPHERLEVANEPHVDREVVETWYDHRHSAVQSRSRVAPVRCSRCRTLEPAAPDSSRPRPFRSPPGKFFPFGDIRNPPSAHNAMSLGTRFRQLRRRKRSRTRSRSCGSACGPPTPATRGPGTSSATGISEMDVFREVQNAALATAARPGLIYGDFRATTMKQPHLGGLPTSYRLQMGDLFILDFSVVLNGYRSDFTNTIAVGLPTIETAGDCSRSARRPCGAGEAVLRAGTRAADVYAAVSATVHRRRPAAPAPPRRPRHRPGPSGAADLRPRERRRAAGGRRRHARAGLVSAGIGGMRFEHNYLITETGAERLSNHKISLT